MAKATADIESSTTGHERAQEDLKNLLDRGGTTAVIGDSGDGSTEPGDPAGTRIGEHHEESGPGTTRSKG